jgi:hypothetical protein
MSTAKCIAGLKRAAGRDLTDDEVRTIFEKLHKAALDIKAGRVDVADVNAPIKNMQQAVAGDQLFQMAAERAANELVHDAEVSATRTKLQIARLSARKAELDNLTQSMDGIEAVKNLIARDYSGKTNVASLEQMVRGHKDNFLRKLNLTWDALGDDFLGFFQDKQKLTLLIKELRGEDTGDAIAKNGAKAFHDVAEEARQVFNQNGGDIGKLNDPYMPQHHSQLKVADAAHYLGRAKSNDPAVNKQAWTDYMMPLLSKTRDQGKYYLDDLGNPFTDDALRGLLDKAWDNIATDGHASSEVGVVAGAGRRAGRHVEHRQIHFPDADSVIKYWDTFGEKTAVEILHGHIEMLARDIAFIEHFGPNPDVTYRTLRDLTVKDMTVKNPAKTTEIEGRAHKLDNLYNYASGRTKSSANLTVSNIADGIAHLNVAGKLGGAVIASLFGDKAMLEAVSHMNDLPVMQRWGNELRMLNPRNSAERHLLQQQGLMLEGVRSGLNRIYEGLGGGGAGKSGAFKSGTGKIGNAVMRITGMNAINELRKGAFGLTLMSAFGKQIKAGVDFNNLHDTDIRALKHYGITEMDWKTWRLANLQDLGHGNVASLTPESISGITDAQIKQAFGADADPVAIRRQAIVKLLGAVNTESDFAIVTPGWRERAQFHGDTQRGTVRGEIWRSMLQFKSFPWAFLQRGMDAIANMDGPASKAAMTAYLIASTTIAGAMIIQTRDLLSGKDLRKMLDENAAKFWGAAFLQGGALGIYGDFLYGVNQTRYGSGPIEALSGPTLGPLLEIGLVTPLTAAKKAMEGKESHFLANEFRNVKGFIPGGNMWFAKAALDHLVWQQAMDAMSPGYINSMRKRTAKEYDQDWWWKPGELLPERAPDFGAAFE